MRIVIRAIRLLVGMSLRTDRSRLTRAVALMILGYVATPLIALTLKLLTNAVLAGQVGAAVGYGLAAAGLLILELMGAHFAFMSYYEMSELIQNRLISQLFATSNHQVPLERREQPDYADALDLVKTGLWGTTQAVEALLQMGGLLAQLVFSTVLLAGIHPLLVLLPILIFAPVTAGHFADRRFDRAREAGASHNRRSGHLLKLALSPADAVELRLMELEPELVTRFRSAWRATTRLHWRGQWTAAAVRIVGQLLFAAAYLGSLTLVLREVAANEATAGDFVLVLALAIQVSAQVGAASSLLGALFWTGRTARRLDWLVAQPAAGPAPDDAPEPDPTDAAPTDGIAIRHLSFTYPGGHSPVLRDIDLVIPGGTLVALIGENGAGKSTLVKLLCGLYSPTRGSIDGAAQRPGPRRTASLFQDFARIELTLQESVGVGDLAESGTAPVRGALAAADATALPDTLPDGLSTYLGQSYADGVELSGGQWQKVALARALMLRHAELLVLDEPAGALDALTEHALFDRFAMAAGRGTARGSITVFVSHRFSTARLADLIVVLQDGRITQCGSHEELLATGGLYADLYRLQASGYA